MPRMGVLLLAAALATACDPYFAVQEADTIEAYETYLTDNPNGSRAFEAATRLEELYLRKARKSKELADFDAYLERFPKGRQREAANLEREAVLFDRASATGTAAAWKLFLDEYPKPRKRRGRPAKDGLQATAYVERHTTMSAVRIEGVNLAENPDGPIDGKGFRFDLTNNGDQTLTTLTFAIDYLGADDVSLGRRTWPLVAPKFPTPIEEEKKVPLEPGDTRTWDWTTGDLPDGWAEKVRISPIRIRFAEAD